MKPFFGYPGGKSKASKLIFEKLKISGSPLYIEPFAGAFSFGLFYAEKFQGNKLWLNEYDTDLYCLWKATVENTEDLCESIKKIKIYSDLFYELREKLSKKRPFNKKELMERALEKLIIHKISFSNLGEKSGSPVGGKKQKNKYKYDFRWKPDLICNRIKAISKLISNIKITNLSYEKVLDQVSIDHLVYCDPPYVDGGPKCYKNYFSNLQHAQLADNLMNAKYKWFLTYDNNNLIKCLYKNANIQDLNLKYSMSSCSQKQNTVKTVKELLISNF